MTVSRAKVCKRHPAISYCSFCKKNFTVIKYNTFSSRDHNHDPFPSQSVPIWTCEICKIIIEDREVRKAEGTSTCTRRLINKNRDNRIIKYRTKLVAFLLNLHMTQKFNEHGLRWTDFQEDFEVIDPDPSIIPPSLLHHILTAQAEINRILDAGIYTEQWTLSQASDHHQR